MTARIVFLCARGSSRSILAASLLAAHAGERWEVWGTPTHDEQGRLLAEQVLRERSIAPIPSGHLIQPAFGMRWDEGVVLCSGTTDT
ncbi:MAG TPA: hypothetical protein VKR83_01365 [Ktedonobacteraceae bacterium]|nr:hypothetical protein [Ktedonobacteraceae bacterium]